MSNPIDIYISQCQHEVDDPSDPMEVVVVRLGDLEE